MKRKEKLIESLRLVIDALKNDTIHYDWREQSSCNMGVVAQAILNVDVKQLEELRSSLFDPLLEINKERRENKKGKIDVTWKNSIRYVCPMTGKKLPEIIKKLESFGLSRVDMVHLEYLENPAILELSGIEKECVVEKVQVGTEQKEVSVNWFLNLFGYTKKVEVPIYEDKETYQYPEGYYTKRENVVKYLSAWLMILLDKDLEIKHGSNKHVEETLNLERELILALADEDYDKAVVLRDDIAKQKLALSLN